MIFCPNLNDPNVKDEFEKLSKTLGENEAYLVWNKNKGEQIINSDSYKEYINSGMNQKQAIIAVSKDIINSNITNDRTMALKPLLDTFKVSSNGVISGKTDLNRINGYLTALGLNSIDVVPENGNYQLRNKFTGDKVTKNDLLYNTQYEINLSEATNPTINAITSTLKRIGVRVKAVDNFKTKHPDKIVALADIVNKVILVSKGRDISLQDVTEEAAHFFIEALGDDSPLSRRLVDNIIKSDLIKSILDNEYQEYYDLYNGDETVMAKEALGKLLANFLNDPGYRIPQATKSLLERLWSAIKAIFGKMDNALIIDVLNDDLARIANDIMSEKADYITRENLENSVIRELYKVGKKIENLDSVIDKLLDIELRRNYMSMHSSTTTDSEILSQEKMIELLQDSKIPDKKKIVEYLKNSINVLNEYTKQLRDSNTSSMKAIRHLARLLENIKKFQSSFADVSRDIDSFLSSSKDNQELNDEIKALYGEILTIVSSLNNIVGAKRKWMFAAFLEKINPSFLKRGINPFLSKKEREAIKDSDNMSIIEMLSKTNKDISFIDRWLTSVGDSSNEILQLVYTAMNNSEIEASRKTTDKEYIIRKAMEKLRKAGYSEDFIIERDKNGNDTGNYINPYDYDRFYKEKTEMYNSLFKKYNLPSDSEKRGEFLKNNPDIAKKYRREVSKWIKEHTTPVDNWQEINKRNKKEMSPAQYAVWSSKNINVYIGRKGVKVTPKGDLLVPIYKNTLFEKEMSIPAKKEFYDTIISIHKEALDLLPPFAYDNYYMRPQIHANFRERVYQRGVSEFKNFKESLDTEVIRQIDDEEFGSSLQRAVIDFDGNEMKFVPIYYVRKLKDGQTLSTDILKTSTMFYYMAQNYSIKSQFVDILEQGRDVFEEISSEIDTTGKEKYQTIETINKIIRVTAKKRARRLYDTYNDFIDSVLYGLSQVDEGSFKVFGFEVSKTKFANLLKKYTSYVLLGASPMVTASNIFTGRMTMLQEAQAGNYFTKKELLKADKIFAEKMLSALAESGKSLPDNYLFHLANFFNILGDYSDRMADTNAGIRNLITKSLSTDVFMVGLRAGDYSMKLPILIASMLHTKVLNKEGKEVDLVDQFEINNGIPRIKPDTKKLDGSDWTDNDLNAFIAKQYRLQYSLFGPTRTIDKGMANRWVAGRMIMQFRQFLPAALSRRFAKAHYDTSTDKWTEGMYITLYNFIVKDLKDMHWQFSSAWNNLTYEQRSNLIRSFVEIGTIALFTGLIALLSRIDPDDDDYVLLTSKVMLTRTLLELMAISPIGLTNDLFKILKSPAAILSVLGDIYDFITFAFNPWNWTDEYTTGTYAGMNRMAIKLFKLLPGNRVVMDLISMENKLKYYNNQ